jgi:hypothetical protein
MMLVPLAISILASCTHACQAVDADVVSLTKALHDLETRFESQGAAMQAQLIVQHAKIAALIADDRALYKRSNMTTADVDSVKADTVEICQNHLDAA